MRAYLFIHFNMNWSTLSSLAERKSLFSAPEGISNIVKLR